MTDAEIHKFVDAQPEQECRSIWDDPVGPVPPLVRGDSVNPGPPLLVIARGHLTPDVIARFRQAWIDQWRGGRTDPAPSCIVLKEGMEVYQLIDGVWKPLRDAQ